MPADMVYGDKGQIQRIGHGLREAHAYEYRTDQARRIGYRDGVNLPFCQARVRERLLRQTGDGLHMLARGDLRHDAAIECVHVRLRQNRVREHRPSVAHDGDRRLIAGGFKSQNVHCCSASPVSKYFVRISASSFGRS